MARFVVDGKEAVFGRMASFVAKELLKGNGVDVINCEAIIISGSKKEFVAKLLAKMTMGRGSSMKGPKYSRVEDMLVKRMIRGMLPWDRARGRQSFRNLRCYIGNGKLKEEELRDVKVFNHEKPMKYFAIKDVVDLLASRHTPTAAGAR